MFKPDIYVKNVFDIPYNHLFEEKKLFCFDLDNTLDSPDNLSVSISPELIALFDKIKSENCDIYIYSNNKMKNRVKSFCDIYGLEYKFGANKPFQKEYCNDGILKKYKKKEIIFIGDKIITDIIGAKLYGCTSILVDPIYPSSRKWYSIIMQISDTLFSKIINFKRGKYYES